MQKAAQRRRGGSHALNIFNCSYCHAHHLHLFSTKMLLLVANAPTPADQIPNTPPPPQHLKHDSTQVNPGTGDRHHLSVHA